MKKLLLAAGLVLLLLVAYLWATSPNGYSGNTHPQIRQYQGVDLGGSMSPVAFVQDSFMPRHTGIRRYHAQVTGHGRTAVSSDGKYQVYRTIQIQGGNFVDPNIIRYNVKVTWRCDQSNPGYGTGRFLSLQTWGDADGYSLWSFDGTSSVVQGHGTNSYGVEYWYRRATGKFSRGLDSFSQHVYPWIAFTARGDCTYMWDKKVSE